MNSLQLRLGVGLLVSLVAAFFVLWWLLSSALRLQAEAAIATHLEHDAESILTAIEIGPTGRITLDSAKIEPVYHRPFSGQYYRIMADDRVIRSRSLWDQDLHPSPIQSDKTQTLFTTGPRGQPLMVLVRGFSRRGKTLTIAVAEDLSPTIARIHLFQQRYSIIALFLLLTLIAVQGLIVAGAFRPLRRIPEQIRALERGERHQLDTRVPAEVVPLVEEVNRLLTVLQHRLQRSRNALGDLAHALKTPLTVVQQLAREEALKSLPATRETLEQETANMQRLMARVLKRARLAGSGPPLSRFDAGREIPDLVNALKRMYRDKPRRVELRIAEAAPLPIDREDMLELTGNLLDNAWKWARTSLRCTLAVDRAVELTVEDDGPGVADDGIATLTERGTRLDEAVAGHGLGLSIAKLIAEQHGGRIEFGRSLDLGGFRVVVVLPV
jgi:signal transduction histidine kinase